jgi:protein-S-isoprenylcysteine O-methyltransferase Ste14
MAADTEPAGDTAGVIAPPPLIYLAGLAIGLVLDAVLPDADLPGIVRYGLGGLALLVGLGLMGSFVRAFAHASTDVRPDRPTTAIVTGGPYRFTRNPGYLGMALVFTGIALLANAPWALLLLLPTMAVIDRGVIAREERYLEAKFGPEYTGYKARVRRWV